MSRTRLVLAAAPLVLVGAALNGCGVADAQVRPGVAADVDGTSVSLQTVDDATNAVCDYVSSGAAGKATPFPRSLQRRDIATTYIVKAALEHVMKERGLSLPDSYQTDLASIDTQLAGLDDDLGALRNVSRANAYVSAAEVTIGDAEFEAAGDVASTLQISEARGRSAVNTWMVAHDIDLNPVLGLEVTDDGPTPTAGELSIPVSHVATSAVIDVNDPDVEKKVGVLVADLPADQVCGPKPS